MAVMGVITEQKAEELINKKRTLLARLFMMDHKSKHCLAVTGNGNRCKNLHSGRNTLTCAIHSHKINEQEYIARHIRLLRDRFDRIAEKADHLYQEIVLLVERIESLL